MLEGGLQRHTQPPPQTQRDRPMAGSTKLEIGAALLRTLHRIHRQRADLSGQIGRGPRQIAAGESLVGQAQQRRDAAAETLRRARMSADEKQLQLQSREAHVQGLKAKLNTAASNREYSLLRDQIAADQQANSVQSDEILETLERIDTLQAELAEAERELEREQQEHAQRTAEIDARMQLLREELGRVDEELTRTEAQIPATILRDYRRMVEAKGEDALAPVEGDSCGGCYQTLTTQVMSQLRLSQLIHCPSCNAFLYLPEDTQVR